MGVLCSESPSHRFVGPGGGVCCKALDAICDLAGCGCQHLRSARRRQSERTTAERSSASFHRLRELQAKIVTEWQIGKLSGKDYDLLAAAVLTAAKKDREKIAKDLEAAETSFGQRGRKD